MPGRLLATTAGQHTYIYICTYVVTLSPNGSLEAMFGKFPNFNAFFKTKTMSHSL